MANPCISEIRSFINNGKLERALKKFVECAEGKGSLANVATQLSSQYQQAKHRNSLGLIGFDKFKEVSNQVSYTLLGSVDLLDKNEEEIDPEIDPNAIKVFISYHPEDLESAKKVKEFLHAEQMIVQMKLDNQQVGRKIAAYTKNAIQESDYTVAIVSSQSLLDSQIASEIYLTFMQEQVLGGTQFFPCYIDEDFLQPSFLLSLIKQTDQKLQERKQYRAELLELNVDASDLSQEITQLSNFRNSAAKILQDLKSRFMLDIRGEKFEFAMQTLTKSLKEASRGTTT